MAHVKVTQVPLPATIIVTRDNLYYRWRYQEEPESRARMSGVRAHISKETALDAIKKNWQTFHRGRVVFVKAENIP